MRRNLLCVGACALVLIVSPGRAEGQMHFGPQLGVGTDSGLGLGARLVFPLRTSALGMDGVLDGTYFFGGGAGVDRWVDTNLNVRIPVPIAEDFTMRFGAGANFTFVSVDTGPGSSSSESKVGLNLLASVGLPAGLVAPFLELRVILSGAEQLVFTGGFTVGPRR